MATRCFKRMRPRWQPWTVLLKNNRGLDPATPHLLEIEPVFDDAKAQELKIESIGVAGGKATVTLER